MRVSDLRRHPRTRTTLAAALVLAGSTAGCGAPQAEALRGPVADEVRTALDSGTATFRHGEWDALLGEAVRGDLVDYRYLQRHRDRLDAYLARVAGADLASLAPSQLEALLINAYNAYTVRAILEHPTVSSIREIDGVWTETTHPVGGHELTLDQIEHGLLRPFFRDPRIHFAVNCASRSCAPLPPWAFSGDSLRSELEARTRRFLRNSEHVRIEEGTLLVSRYFDWYAGDFTAEDWEPRAETIPLFVAGYSRPEVAEFVADHEGRPPVAFLDYDWSLNAAVPPEATVALFGGRSPGDGVAGRTRPEERSGGRLLLLVLRPPGEQDARDPDDQGDEGHQVDRHARRQVADRDERAQDHQQDPQDPEPSATCLRDLHRTPFRRPSSRARRHQR